jgi:hypothetical protein
VRGDEVGKDILDRETVDACISRNEKLPEIFSSFKQNSSKTHLRLLE